MRNHGRQSRGPNQSSHVHQPIDMMWLCLHFPTIITVTSWWVWRRLKSPASCLLNRLFKHRSKKTSKLRVTGLCEGNSAVNSPHKGPVTRKMFPFDDVIMTVWLADPTTDWVVHHSSCPGYFRQPQWLSLGLPEISRVTWQVCIRRLVVYIYDMAVSHGTETSKSSVTRSFRLVARLLLSLLQCHWCAILIAHQIVMAKHGGSCVHFSGISTCGRTSRETVSHPQCPPLPNSVQNIYTHLRYCDK